MKIRYGLVTALVVLAACKEEDVTEVVDPIRPVRTIVVTRDFADHDRYFVGIAQATLDRFAAQETFFKRTVEAVAASLERAGMMIKYAIVLIDEINDNLDRNQTPYDAVVNAGVSRLRPVMLAAATTVLGVIPLLPDVFWIGLAVTILGGLTIGTVLTMILEPVLYAALHRIKEDWVPAQAAAAPA